MEKWDRGDVRWADKGAVRKVQSHAYWNCNDLYLNWMTVKYEIEIVSSAVTEAGLQHIRHLYWYCCGVSSIGSSVRAQLCLISTCHMPSTIYIARKSPAWPLSSVACLISTPEFWDPRRQIRYKLPTWKLETVFAALCVALHCWLFIHWLLQFKLHFHILCLFLYKIFLSSWKHDGSRLLWRTLILCCSTFNVLVTSDGVWQVTSRDSNEGPSEDSYSRRYGEGTY